ncbi:MAG: lysophospholipid acyltransferase family protein [bacterium]|nr:lysophospholipid acyltransferase family protein [bacterium]
MNNAAPTPSGSPYGKSSVEMTVEEFIAAQPRFTWRRTVLRFGIRWVILKLMCRTTVMGTENIPNEGGAILMMNHITLLDPLLCVGAILNRFVIPMSKIENLHTPIVGTLIRWYGGFMVNRGEVDRKALTNSIELIKNGQLILIAPEGTRQKHGLTEAKDGLAYVATKADAIIIPAAISGPGNWLGELKRLRRPRYVVAFGKPFRFKTDGKGRVSREALSMMSHEAMYQLAATLTDPEQRGVYRDLSKATTEHLEFLHL